MYYDLTTNSISPGEDIQDYFSKKSPTEVSGIISKLVDRILDRDFEHYWRDFSYPVAGGSVDARPYFFYEYLTYLEREQSIQNILSPDNNDASENARYLELITDLL